jgi:hypothetical protein
VNEKTAFNEAAEILLPCQTLALQYLDVRKRVPAEHLDAFDLATKFMRHYILVLLS